MYSAWRTKTCSCDIDETMTMAVYWKLEVDQSLSRTRQRPLYFDKARSAWSCSAWSFIIRFTSRKRIESLYPFNSPTSTTNIHCTLGTPHSMSHMHLPHCTWCCTFHISCRSSAKFALRKTLRLPLTSPYILTAAPPQSALLQERLEVRLAAPLREEQEVSQGGQHHEQHVLSAKLNASSASWLLRFHQVHAVMPAWCDCIELLVVSHSTSFSVRVRGNSANRNTH